VLGDLEWMEGSVPTPHGMIHVSMNRQQVKVRTTEGHCWLIVGHQRIAVNPNEDVVVNL